MEMWRLRYTGRLIDIWIAEEIEISRELGRQ